MPGPPETESNSAMFPRLKSLTLSLALYGTIAAAELPDGRKSILLSDENGTNTEVGHVVFSSAGDSATYQITLNEDAFADHFLSMRPFKCLEGTEKHWCHVPYPYDIQRRITADDLTDLEYDLLFLWKGATDYGINMWNGVYYRLSYTDGGIIGALHEMDMDTLSAPPVAGNLRPIAEKHLHEADPDSHWLPVLWIK